MTPASTPAADLDTQRSPAADHGFPRGSIVAVLVGGTHLPLLALLAHRFLLPADRATGSTAVPLMALLLPATVLGSVAVVWALLRLDRSVRSLRELSRRDELTGTYNRRAGEERLAEDLARSFRNGARLTLAIVDTDGLKGANDSFGHAAGDACLRHLAQALRRNVREGDWVARWGGDEFVVGLWDVHDQAPPENVLERVARDLRESPVVLAQGGKELGLTFSAGLSRSVLRDRPKDLLERADALLYEAKREGRARIVLEPATAPAPGCSPTDRILPWVAQR